MAMKHKLIEKTLVDRLSKELILHNFEVNRIDLDKEHNADFILNGDKVHHIFGVRFLHYEKNIALESDIIASYDEVTELAKKVVSWESKYFKDYLAMSSRLGIALNPKNKDGFFNDNDCLQIELEPNEKSIDRALSILMKKFFRNGALSFIEKTNTIQKADFITNSWVRKGEPMRLLTYYPHVPWQMTTGIVLAKLTKNPRYAEILDVYQDFIRDRLSPDSERIKDFKAFVKYFDVSSAVSVSAESPASGTLVSQFDKSSSKSNSPKKQQDKPKKK